MHEVHLPQCKNSYSSGDCGQDLWPGLHPRQGSEVGRGPEGSFLENARGDAEPGAAAPVSLSSPWGTRTAPGVPKPNLLRPSPARPSLSGHVSPSGSKVRASCGWASSWEGCAGRGGAAQEWSPAPPRPGWQGRGLLEAGDAPAGSSGGSRAGRGGAGEASRPRPRAPRAPVAGEKSALGPASSPRAQRPPLARLRNYAETLST